MDIAIMIEGQNGLNWPRWQKVVDTVEGLGFAGLYRSDHFTNSDPPDKDSLDLWISLAWLADNTKRLDFGPLVTPFSFRHPAHIARMAAAVDDLSGGRLTIGVGAGWQEREHRLFGFPLLDMPDRFQRLEEGLEVLTRLLHSDSPSRYSGEYYSLDEAVMLPRPSRPGGPPILIGGNGEKRTLPLAARFADEWNAVFTTTKEVERLNVVLDQMLEELGRKPSDVRRSFMTGCIFGPSDAHLKEKLALYGDNTIEELRDHGFVIGTPSQVSEQVGLIAETNINRVMLQWLDLDDLDGLEKLASAVL